MLPKTIATHPNLDMIGKLVFAVLWTRRNGENKAWPGQSKIADALGISKRSVVRAIKQLEAAGLVVKHRTGKRATNRYCLPENDVTASHFTSDSRAPHKCQPVTSNSKRTYKRTNNGEITLKDGTRAKWHNGAWRPLYDLSKKVNPSYLPNP